MSPSLNGPRGDRSVYLSARILGVVSHVIIPEVGIAALDLELAVPDSTGPSFKVLIDSARFFGTLLKSKGIPLKTAARTEHGSTRLKPIMTD